MRKVLARSAKEVSGGAVFFMLIGAAKPEQEVEAVLIVESKLFIKHLRKYQLINRLSPPFI